MTGPASSAGPAYIGLLVTLILVFSFSPSTHGTTAGSKVRGFNVQPFLELKIGKMQFGDSGVSCKGCKGQQPAVDSQDRKYREIVLLGCYTQLPDPPRESC